MLELIASHPEVDAVIQLGLGIQSNQARLMKDGRFYPDHGLERIVAYHERQDARFAQAAADISDATGKPILLATELAVADPDERRPGHRQGHGTALLRRRPTGPSRRSSTSGSTPGSASDAAADLDPDVTGGTGGGARRRRATSTIGEPCVGPSSPSCCSSRHWPPASWPS